MALEEDVVEGNESEEGGEQKVDESKYIPIERFNEVYGKFKDYERSMKEWGDLKPSEVKAQMQKLREWEKAVDEAKKAASATPDEKQSAERAARVRKELMQIFPELGKLSKIDELESRYEGLSAGEAEATAREVLTEHSNAFAPMLKTAGIDPKYQSDIEEYIAGKMSEEEKIAFLQGDFDIAKSIFEASLKEGLLSLFVRKAAPISPALRNPVGGTVAKGGKSKPLTMKEAEDIGWSRMNGGGE